MPQQPQQPPIDPVVARAMQLLKGQNVTEPIQVVTPTDYDSIHLPAALRPNTSQAEGFRVWRGPQPDAPIYVNRQNRLYEDAANADDPAANLLMASMLVHEHTHSTHMDEPSAYAAQSAFLSSNLGTLPPDKQIVVRRFMQAIQDRAKAAKK